MLFFQFEVDFLNCCWKSDIAWIRSQISNPPFYNFHLNVENEKPGFIMTSCCYIWRKVSETNTISIDPYIFTWQKDLKWQINEGKSHAYIKLPLRYVTMLGGSLSPLHGASSGCGWRKDLQIRRVAVNISNNQSRKAGKGWSSTLGAGHGANNPSP
jgi:hypothetical protein